LDCILNLGESKDRFCGDQEADSGGFAMALMKACATSSPWTWCRVSRPPLGSEISRPAARSAKTTGLKLAAGLRGIQPGSDQVAGAQHHGGKMQPPRLIE
jgi:hypothetical protein